MPRFVRDMSSLSLCLSSYVHAKKYTQTICIHRNRQYVLCVRRRRLLFCSVSISCVSDKLTAHLVTGFLFRFKLCWMRKNSSIKNKQFFLSLSLIDRGIKQKKKKRKLQTKETKIVFNQTYGFISMQLCVDIDQN